MRYECKIEGIAPIIMHSGKGLDPRLPAKIEIDKITGKRGKRTPVEEERLRELECLVSLWRDGDTPTIPPAAIRSTIEKAARKSKDGPAVREGMLVLKSAFTYDVGKYGSTLGELGKSTQFTEGVVVNGKRVLRTRAMFETPWECQFMVDVDDTLVERDKLAGWLTIAGRRIGLGDWRPEKSGIYGRFAVNSISEISD